MLKLRLIAARGTDRGQKRKVNEDTILDYTGASETGENFGLYIVCDGLGGHDAGDVASKLAVRSVTKEIQRILPPMPAIQMSSADINNTVWTAVQNANEAIWRYAENNETQPRGMGTTLTMAVVINEMAHIAHVGDSRLYLLRHGKLERLTQDHTMAAVLAEAGHITQEEIVDHPRQNILTRALGRQEKIEVELMELPLQSGDMLLLCSDGLWKAFKDDEALGKRLNERRKTAELCEQLIIEANELDGSDNISLIIVAAYEQKSASQERYAPRVQAEQEREVVPVPV